MKKIARALGILLFVAFSFSSCSKLFDEKKYNESTLADDYAKYGGGNGGSGSGYGGYGGGSYGGNGGGYGGNGGGSGNGSDSDSSSKQGPAPGDSYVLPETYANKFTDTRFYYVRNVKWTKITEKNFNSTITLTPDYCDYSFGGSCENEWTPGSYITLKSNNKTVESGTALGNIGIYNQYCPTYDATLKTTSTYSYAIGNQVIVLALAKEGFLALNSENYTQLSKDYVTFYFTKYGWEKINSNNGEMDVTFDVVFPTETDISLTIDSYKEVTRYQINVDYDQNTGYVLVRPDYHLAKGLTAYVTLTPLQGYKIKSISAKDSAGNKIKVTKNQSQSTKLTTEYYFTMPASDVSVTAIFVEDTQ